MNINLLIKYIIYQIYLKKSRKGIPLKNLSKPAAIKRAKLAAITRKKNRDEREGITGTSKKIVLNLDEALFNDFIKSCDVAHDPTPTAGIRRAIQDYIDKHPG